MLRTVDDDVRLKQAQEKAYTANPTPNDCNQGQIQGGASNAYSEDYALREMFTYHTPSHYQQKCYENIREAAKHFAKVLLMNTPKCSDQSAAIRKVREAVMTANAAIALDGMNF